MSVVKEKTSTILRDILVLEYCYSKPVILVFDHTKQN
jgi:hypothetical protein